MARIVSENYAKRPSTLTFVDDAPNGGCIVQCPCGAEFNELDLESCPKCKTDLIYPGWAEW